MTWQLVEEVLDHAPGELTPAETLVLVAIAEWCGEDKRLDGRECERSTIDLARRTRVKIGSIRVVLQRLAGRNLDVRVRLGTDKNGDPVFCHRGRVPRYRLPTFPVPKTCECNRCHRAREGGTTVSPSPEKGETPSPPSTAEGGTEVPPSTPEGGTSVAEGGTAIAEGGTVVAEGGTTVPPFPSSVLPTVREGGRTEEETAARRAEPAAATTTAPPEALALIAELPWPPGQRPSLAVAASLAVKAHAAIAEHGLAPAELDIHLRGRMLRAKTSPASYLSRALEPEHLPIPVPEKPPEPVEQAPRAPTAVINDVCPRDAADLPAPASDVAREAARSLFAQRRKSSAAAQERAQREPREQLTAEQERERRRQLLTKLETQVISSAS